MNSEKNIEVQLEELAKAVASKDSFVQDVMSRIETSSDKPQKQSIKNHVVRRFFMKNTFKLAAAAVILIAAVLSITLLDKTVTPAYALEQTIRACHSVRFIHMRQIKPGHEDEPVLVWAEFFADGQPKAIRLHLPEWQGGEDGAKEIVWKNNVAEVWFKKKNLFVRLPDQEIAGQILKIAKEQDPKFLVQALMDKQADGKCEIQIEQPSDKAEPIRVISTTLPDKELRLVVYVDQATQLPLKGETYSLKDGQYVLNNTGEYYDYNQPIDSKMFTFNNVSQDVMQIDQTTQKVGLPQGQMTNDEVAVEVVRQFWQAMIDKDYAKASQMYEGIPVAMLEKAFSDNSKGKLLEIVSVGPVQPHWEPKTGGGNVPCTIKIEKDGQVVEQTFDKIGVRQVHSQPGRWTIFGGL